MNLTFRQLRLFLALADTGSVSAAARALHVTQPTASMQLKEITQSIGMPVYEVVGKRVFLTEAGRELAETARAIAGEWEALRQKFDAMRGLTRGRLRVALVNTAQYFMPRLLGGFCQQHPEIDISLQVLNRDGVVARLRDPDGGCPWDLEQTHASLVPYVLEEAHEVADAIRHGDDRHLAEELGDLLLQVVLHAQIASEDQRFDLAAVASGITQKLVRRHPHVFAEGEARPDAPDAAAVKARSSAARAWSSMLALYRKRARRPAREGADRLAWSRVSRRAIAPAARASSSRGSRCPQRTSRARAASTRR